MTAARLLVAMAFLGASLFATSCDHRAGAEHANVLLIVVDTLRADHLGSYGYTRPTSPRIDALAERGVRFANARAPSSWTLPSVASLLTGLYPAVHGAEQSDSVLPEGLDTLAVDFLEAGYQTAALSANPAFVTPRQGLGRGFEHFDVLHGKEVARKTPGAVPADAALSRWVVEATAEDVTAAALAWLDERDPDKPFFLYAHYFDPHAAYTPPPEYAQRFGVSPEARLTGDAQWRFLLAPEAPLPGVLSTLVSLYDAEIAATDAAIGRLLDALPEPIRRSTIVVVTSDHGEEFGDHGGVQHGRTLFDELLRVPLILAGPGLSAGRVVDSAVSLTGLRATLADLTRLAPPQAETIEPSFESWIRNDPEMASPIFADLDKRFESDQQQHRRALLEGPWKLLVSPDRRTALHDLTSDPGEARAVAGQSALLDQMTATLLERDVAAVARRSIAPPQRIILDAAKRQQLKALGYLQ